MVISVSFAGFPSSFAALVFGNFGTAMFAISVFARSASVVFFTFWTLAIFLVGCFAFFTTFVFGSSSLSYLFSALSSLVLCYTCVHAYFAVSSKAILMEFMFVELAFFLPLFAFVTLFHFGTPNRKSPGLWPICVTEQTARAFFAFYDNIRPLFIYPVTDSLYQKVA
jgi:hypothetical protein